jgi:hypothetical protein
MSSKPRPFPWEYFDSPTDEAAEAVVRWIYCAFAARAYGGFLEQGRGLLVGPFLTDQNRRLIATQQFVERRGDGEAVGLTVLYVAANSPTFQRTLEQDESWQEQLLSAVERYDPTRECVILLLVNNVPHTARIVGSSLAISTQAETVH